MEDNRAAVDPATADANRLEDPNAADREFPSAGQSVPPAEDAAPADDDAADDDAAAADKGKKNKKS